ncbi:MAG: magnesium transporter [Acholeplasmatales bacterium]|jgi:magnesium transporter|nr:magnesium transporter [Acholeplasmatales bacterium]
MLKDLLLTKDNNTILEYINNTHSFDISKEFFLLSDEDKDYIIKLLDSQKLAEILSYEPELTATLFEELTSEEQVSIINELEPDDAADIINELEEEDKRELLSHLIENEDKQDILELLAYDDNQTGAHMTTNYVSLLENIDVKEATKIIIQEAKEKETISTIMIINSQEEFVGTISLNSLLKARSPKLVNELIENTTSVLDTQDTEDSMNSLKNYSMFLIPVVNKDNKLVGVLTLDDAIDIAILESKEDISNLAALPKDFTDKSIFKTSLKRLPWLVAFLLMGIIIALVTGRYDDVLKTIPLLIIFQPLILDASGDVGTQTLAIFLKLLVDKNKTIKKDAIKEILVGVGNGFIVGVVAFGAAYIFCLIDNKGLSEPLKIASIVGLSLWATVMTAPVFAIIMPLIIKLFRLDPSIASGPFITTLIDITSLFIYLGLAGLIIGGIF